MDLNRVEHDLLGEIRLSSNDLFGIHTARASENFRLGGESLRQFPALLTALAQVKSAAAWANVKLGVLPEEIGNAIMGAAAEVAAGDLHEHFPLDVVQGGGGTSTNMNMNEVLATRAAELLATTPETSPNGHAPRTDLDDHITGDPGGQSAHMDPRGQTTLSASHGQSTRVVRDGHVTRVDPHDHVNRSQSTNDVMPTALNIAVLTTAQATVRSLRVVAESLRRQAARYRSLERLGRTCLQDAVPVPAGLVHDGQASAVLSAARLLESAAGELRGVPLGATAIGTGLGAPPGYAELALERLAEETGLALEPAANLSDGIASLEAMASVADAMARGGRVLARVASDLRLLSSGPVGGIAEVRLPPMQAGSSIMPGKVNPVIPELVMQVSFQLEGGAHTVHLACAAGELEVTPWGPVVTAELLRGLRRLERVAMLFATRCLDGMAWNEDAVRDNLRGSLREAVESAVEHGHAYAVTHFPLERLEAPEAPDPAQTPDPNHPAGTP
ncbi:lyase family protein [Nonomuraea endophytica]|uniref:Aspartate ammonia-lyase n=1 Tax=Nonomuraea endophytica TaxID=714136 RepID=A0A7W8EKA5_9ACTN|nr:lyase family protein [Nonomuraea endophytica]MBB5081552.1 aspartate ammonia-lyase [Nonomuraea endophytica]